MEHYPEWRKSFESFAAREVEYLVVGGHALAFHGAPRFTGDREAGCESAVEFANTHFHVRHRNLGSVGYWGYRWGLVLSLFFLSSAISAEIYYVSRDGDGTDGLSWTTAYKKPSDAVQNATSGDEIWVEGSTRYRGFVELKTGLSLFGGFSGDEKADEFSSRDWNKHPTVLEDVEAALTTFENTVVDGFVITGGFSGEFTGIRCEGDTVIRNCRVTGNNAWRRGAAITVMSGVSVVLMNCLVDNNIVKQPFAGLPPGGIGSALLGYYQCRVTLIHCTFTHNPPGGDGDFAIDGELTVVNSVIRDRIVGLRSLWSISHSNINSATECVGNINEDPLFVNPEGKDFRLQVNSPCIDAGTDTELFLDLDANPRPVDVAGRGEEGGSSFDMGAYEFQLKKSDLNRDGKTDAEDLLLFREDWHITDQ